MTWWMAAPDGQSNVEFWQRECGAQLFFKVECFSVLMLEGYDMRTESWAFLSTADWAQLALVQTKQP